MSTSATPMRVRVGTSGFSYEAWKGPFYPASMPSSQFLAFYGERFSTVEINNTFYKLPTEKTLATWASEAPPGFSFALKASQFMTHRMRLKKPEASIERLWGLFATLGEKRGPVLVQLPDAMEKDLPLLEAFLARLPEGHRAALEFRHSSWFDDEVAATLRAHHAALVYSEGVSKEGRPLDARFVATTDWGYVRLRFDDYDDATLAAWAEKIRAQAWTEAWVFFKHEDTAMGPKLAARLAKLLG